MLKLFKNKKAAEKKATVSFFQMVNGRIIRSQTKLADWISNKTNKWSTRRWKYFLIIFSIVGSAAATNELVASITGSGLSHTTQFMTVVPPQYIIRPSERDRAPDPRISEIEYSRLVNFENYLDSLKNSNGGRPYYDSLMKARSGLMDTIRVIKRLYLLQKAQ